jgi:hypothetical protein
MTTRRYFANAAPQRTLTGSMTSSQTTLTIAGSFAGWPTQFPFYAAIDVGTLSFEIVSVTAIAGSVAIITRAQDGTTGIAHSAGATVDQAVVRQDLDEANAHTSANSGVHGVAGSVVGTTDVQTLSGKTLTAPTITGGTQASPVINTPTVTTPAVSGGTAANVLHTGDATHTALLGKATTAGGTTLSLQDSTGVSRLSVDDAGNLSTAGAINVVCAIAAAGTVTGGIVNGIIAPKQYANAAARDAAIPVPVAGEIVWLTSPGYASQYNGSRWMQVRGDDSLDVLEMVPTAPLFTTSSGTATWLSIGSSTVPSWASKARVTWGVSGFDDSSASALNVTCVLKIGSAAGVSVRIPGSTVTTPSLSLTTTELLTGLSVGSQTVTISATFVSGSGAFQADTFTRVFASIDYLV